MCAKEDLNQCFLKKSILSFNKYHKIDSHQNIKEANFSWQKFKSVDNSLNLLQNVNHNSIEVGINMKP